MTAGIDPELAAKLHEQARKLVATWPPLTPGQIDAGLRIVGGGTVRPAPRRRTRPQGGERHERRAS